DISVQGRYFHVRVDSQHAGGRDVSFAVPAVFGAEEHAAREIGRFDLVEVDDKDMPHSEQGEILEDFVSQGAGADDEHAAGTESILVPPRNQPHSRISIFFVEVEDLAILATVHSGRVSEARIKLKVMIRQTNER